MKANSEATQTIMKVGQIQIFEREEVVLSFKEVHQNQQKSQDTVKQMMKKAGLKSRLLRDDSHSSKKRKSSKKIKNKKKDKKRKKSGASYRGHASSDSEQPAEKYGIKDNQHNSGSAR